MTQPTERRFVMEPRLDAEVETINNELALKANTADLGEAAYLDQNEFTNIGNLDYAQFDTTYAGGSEAPGQLAWSPENETLEFQLDEHVTLQIGQEHVMRVKNASGSVAIPERTVVMFAGATGDTITVAPAVSDGSINVNYLAGITTEQIPADGFGFVTQLGFINNTNTNGWAVGTILYVDPTVPGGLTPTEPELPAWTMPVAAVTKQSPTAGRLLVRAIPGGSGAGGSSVVISDTVPAGGTKGDLWLDSTDGTMYVYFEDVDGSQWIQVQANSALEGSILQRLSSLESQAIAYGTQSPNYIINGGFDIWQRGTSFTAGGYTADRWNWTGGAGATVSCQTFTPGTEPSNGAINGSYLNLNISSSQVNAEIRHLVEDVRNFAGQTATLSFWARLNSGTVTLRSDAYQYFGTGGSPSPLVAATGGGTFSPTSSWQRFSFQYKFPSISGKTLGTNNNHYLWIRIAQMTNTGTGSLDIWGVQLEQGSTATSFRRNQPNIQAELAACQRYYEKSYDLQFAPGTASATGGANLNFGTSDASGNIVTLVSYKVPKRIPGTVYTWTESGTAGNWDYARSGASGASPTQNTYKQSVRSTCIYHYVGLGWTACTSDGHWAVDAEL